MPVYLCINELHPDSIILVHSEATKTMASRIAKDYPDQTTLCCLEAVEMSKIRPAVEELLAKHDKDNIDINLTGGTKPWAVAFTLAAAGKPNTQLIYVDQNCTFYNYSSGEKWTTSTLLGMQQLMRINGQIPKSYTRLSDYDDADLETMEKTKKLRKLIPTTFNALTIPDKRWRKALQGGNEGTHLLDDGSYVEWNKSKHHVHITARKKQTWINEDFHSVHAPQILFNAGWFEYEVAQMISQWNHAKEVWTNVVFPYRAGQAKNEIDVVVNTGVKLLMIECKTQIYDNTDIDKFHTAVKNYGGMGCKALFITNSHMKDSAREKCADSQVMAFSLNDYASTKQAQNALFAMLDKEIININAK